MRIDQAWQKIFVLLLACISCSGIHLSGQVAGLENQNQYNIHIHKTRENIRIDGELTEEVWKSAEAATHFMNWVPTDIGFPKRQTEVRLTYDNEYIYIGVILYDTNHY